MVCFLLPLLLLPSIFPDATSYSNPALLQRILLVSLWYFYILIFGVYSVPIPVNAK